MNLIKISSFDKKYRKKNLFAVVQKNAIRDKWALFSVQI